MSEEQPARCLTASEATLSSFQQGMLANIQQRMADGASYVYQSLPALPGRGSASSTQRAPNPDTDSDSTIDSSSTAATESLASSTAPAPKDGEDLPHLGHQRQASQGSAIGPDRDVQKAQRAAEGKATEGIEDHSKSIVDTEHADSASSSDYSDDNSAPDSKPNEIQLDDGVDTKPKRTKRIKNKLSHVRQSIKTKLPGGH